MAERFHVENAESGRTKTRAQEATPGLHVPEAPYRPGDEPRFARFSQQPGDLDRPSPQAPAEALAAHSVGLVRVLDDEGVALGPWNPHLSADELRAGLKTMMTVRLFDSRMLTMQRQGRLSFYLESKGEEAVAAAAGMALRAEDMLFPSYRQQGLFLLRGATLENLACQCIGNLGDNAKARQMPVHYSWRRGNIVSISSPVGTQAPQAVGAAMAFAFRKQAHLAAMWIGDGTAAQGDFHYALNFASVYKPPVILNVVNNQWAISTHRNLAAGGKSFATRGITFGMPGIRVDGNDYLAVHAVTSWAAERARAGLGATLIELLTYRRGAHSSSDDPTRYRPADEGRLWPGGDPVERLSDHLISLGEWTVEQQADLESAAEREVLAAFKQAEAIGTLAAGPHPAAETMFDDVYESLPPNLRRQREEMLEAKQRQQQANSSSNHSSQNPPSCGKKPK